MAYDPYLGERIHELIKAKHLDYFTKKMMGGLIFMVHGKMACGIHIDKKYGDSLLMLKIGEQNYTHEITKETTLPMDFTGRPMRGYIFVTPDGFDLDKDLDYWITLALDYNVATYGN